MPEESDSNSPPALTEHAAKQWSMFTHLAGLASLITLGIPLGTVFTFDIPLASILVPLILWLMRREQSEMVDRTGREVLNFQISIVIYYIVATVLVLVLIGMLLLPAVMLLQLIASIVGAIKASNGEEYRYPLTIRFLRPTPDPSA